MGSPCPVLFKFASCIGKVGKFAVGISSPKSLPIHSPESLPMHLIFSQAHNPLFSFVSFLSLERWESDTKLNGSTEGRVSTLKQAYFPTC